MSSSDPTAPTAEAPWLEMTASRYFPSWLAEQGLGLAFTTYQTGKLLFLGLNARGEVSVFERTFDRCMGLWGDGQTLWMNTLYQLWRFENTLEGGGRHNDYDRLYVPRVGYTTGHLDIHDIAVEDSGRVVFVNTSFSCLATLHERHSFTPLWRPPFVSKLAPEDRCHLNGLALEDGKARYATAVSTSDVADSWRDHRADGGCLVDVTADEVIATGLSMPHSPRVHRGELWVLNSGTGFLGRVDRDSGRFEPLAFCPGYARGLAFAGDYAIVGLSQARREKTFSGLALDAELSRRGAEPRCGLLVIDLKTGDTAHWVRLGGMIAELYDVVTLRDVVRPMALGFRSDEIERLLSIGGQGTP